MVVPVDFVEFDALILLVVCVVTWFGVEFRLTWFALVDCKLVCVEFVDAADAAPHIVIVNTTQNTRKPNLFSFFHVVILIFHLFLQLIIQ